MNVQNLAAALRGGLIQQDRLLKLDTPLGPNSLVVQRAIGHSTIGRDYIFTLDVVSTDSAIELKRLIAQPVTLWIQQASGDYRPINGYVYTARRLGADGGLTTYQITLQAWMHTLKFRRDQRIWIDKTVEDIVSDVLKQHPEARGRFRFTLSQSLPNRSYTRQSETDWNFVHRLLESEGLFGYWEQADDGKSHTLVITDRPDTFPDLSPKSISFYRAGAKTEVDAFTQWAGTRTLQSVTLTTRTFDYKNPSDPSNPKSTTVPTIESQGNVPDQLEVYEYTGAYTYLQQQFGDAQSRFRVEEWESRAKRFHGIGGLRAIEAGRRFVLTDHPVHDADPVDQREFATIKASWWIENNLPITLESNFPYSLHDDIADARTSHPGDASLQVPHADGSVGFYLVEVEAQRVSVPYRSPFEHKKPQMHLETAIVVGPQGEEVYTDELNRIRVQFVWDRLNPGNENASCWVRVVQSDTGGGYGGVHVPRIGEEVLIDYVGGDCDRPLAVGRVYNGANQPQWHSDGILSGYRSKEYSGGGYNQLVMDDAIGQNRVQLMSSSANSLLHLGYIIDQSGNSRGSYLGSGFDLRSDAYGAVRASQGLYVTTHPKAANSQPLDVKEAQQQLVTGESLVEAMSGVSEQHQAESLKDAQELRDRWKAGKYQNLLDAIKGALPEDEWVPLCDSMPHVLDGSPTIDLRGAPLQGGRLENLDLSYSHLGFAVFDASQFDEVGFQHAILDGASFKECVFHLAQMLPVYGNRADFRHARFRQSFIEYAKLSNSDLSGVTLSDGSLNFSELIECNFSGMLAEQSEWRWNTTTRCAFVAARFTECRLTATRLDGARLIDATFENCDLSGVDFRGADLTGVHFLGGTFGDVLQGETTYRTRFDDTPEARRAVAAGSTENRHAVEWCPVVIGSSEPIRQVASSRLKGRPGEVVPQSGWWTSPALGSEQGRRYFKEGEKFPDIKSTNWGLVIWSYNSADQG